MPPGASVFLKHMSSFFFLRHFLVDMIQALVFTLSLSNFMHIFVIMSLMKRRNILFEDIGSSVNIYQVWSALWGDSMWNVHVSILDDWFSCDIICNWSKYSGEWYMSIIITCMSVYIALFRLMCIIITCMSVYIALFRLMLLHFEVWIVQILTCMYHNKCVIVTNTCIQLCWI